MEEKRNLIEAALFIAAKPMSLEEIKAIVNLPEDEIKKLLEEMKSRYSDHGIKVVEHEGLFELQIKDEYVKQVEHLAPGRELSRGLLQTLSLISYRAPIKQSEVVKIRGNRAYEHVKELLDKGLIKAEPKGHTKILSLTKKFMDYFGLSNLKDLKERYMAEVKKVQQKEQTA